VHAVCTGTLRTSWSLDLLSCLQALSDDTSKGCHAVGHDLSMAPGGYEIAALAAGGAIAMVDAALDSHITNGYALLRCATMSHLQMHNITTNSAMTSAAQPAEKESPSWVRVLNAVAIFLVGPACMDILQAVHCRLGSTSQG